MTAEPEQFAELFEKPSVEAMYALTPREFEHFVAHELRHAQQYEQTGDTSSTGDLSPAAYQAHPDERDAERWAEGTTLYWRTLRDVEAAFAQVTAACEWAEREQALEASYARLMEAFAQSERKV